MTWMRDRYQALRALIGRSTPEDEIAAEIESHLTMRIEENVREGMSPTDARADAIARFGDVHQIAENASQVDHSRQRARRRSERVRDIMMDLRRALRSLRRAPVFSLTALVVLTLALAAMSAVFTVLYGVVLSPLAYHESDRLIAISHPTPARKEGGSLPLSAGGFHHFAENAKTLEGIGVYTTNRGVAEVGGQAQVVDVATASPSLLSVLGARLVLGRGLTESDGSGVSADVILVSHEYWSRVLKGTRDLSGTRVEMWGRRREVVGVMEPGVRLPGANVDLWVPTQISKDIPANYHFLNAIARLRPGVSLPQAQAELKRLTAQLSSAYPAAYTAEFLRSTGFSVDVRSLRDEVLGDAGRSIWLVFALVVLVLMIACTNVANLFLVRADSRRREAAIRIALGSGVARLRWHFIAECLAVALVAGGLGLVVGAMAVPAILALAPSDIPRLSEVTMSGWTVVLTLTLAVVIGLVLGMLQSMRASGQLTVLREGGRSSTVTRKQQGVRDSLVVGQVALALVLLTAAGVMLRSVEKLREVRPGFDPTNVVALEIVTAKAQSDAELYAKFTQMERDIERLPGVEHVGLTSVPPLEASEQCSALRYDDESSLATRADATQLRCIPLLAVTPGYFRALGMRVMDGDQPVVLDPGSDGVVVSRGMAEAIWPNSRPVGRGVGMRTPHGITSPLHDVRGTVEPTRLHGMNRPFVESVYFLISPGDINGAGVSMTLVVRTRTSDPLGVVPAVRNVVASVDPSFGVSNPRAVEQVIARSMALVTFVTMLLGIAAFMGLLLSGIGLFGAIAYVVSQRRAEIGIRMALGATDTLVVRMITRKALILAGLGVVIGLATAIPVVRTMRSLVYGISPIDPLTMGGASLLLILVAVLAGYLPARRAARIQPVEALR